MSFKNGIGVWVVGIGTLCGLLTNTNLSRAQQVIAEDLIVQGSACIGTDCTDPYIFGFDTLVFQENNLRIFFDDTSETTFPKNDWRISINSSSPNGASYFAIEDATSDLRPFRIDAGAPTDSIRVEANGDIKLSQGTVANTVSMGSTGYESRVTNVAAGIASTDAVNYGQLEAVTDSVSWLSTGTTGSSWATGEGSIAIGSGASAKTGDIAIGLNSNVTADNSTAIGTNSAIHSENSVAIGANATVASDAPGGTAIGQNAQVASGASNSVALGKDSVATEPNTVSVGSPGNERRITNVANGVNTTDAVNKGQLDVVNRRVSDNRNDISTNRRDIDNNSANLHDLRDESRAGIAAAAALVTVMPSAPGKTSFNIGTANFKDQLAFGLTAAHRLVAIEDAIVHFGVSAAGDDVVVRAGASWEF